MSSPSARAPRGPKRRWPSGRRTCVALRSTAPSPPPSLRRSSARSGWPPRAGGLDTDGLAIGADDLAELLKVDPSEWLLEVDPIREFYAQFGEKLPGELHAQLDALKQRLRSLEPVKEVGTPGDGR